MSLASASSLPTPVARPRIEAIETTGERLSDKLAALRRKASGVGNVEIVSAQVASTGLPAECCDAIYLRDVYHHLTQPAELNRDIAKALRPQGTLLIIDFRPGGPLRWIGVEGVDAARQGHGIAPEAAERELGAAGFERVRLIDPWLKRWIGPDLWALVLKKRAPAAPATPR